MRAPLAILISLTLAACAGGGMDDLQQFVAESGKNMHGKAEPLPEVKPYEPFIYAAQDLPDPFKPRKLQPTKGGGALQPNLTRPKEALEAFPLDSLKMVGTLKQKNIEYALVKTPDNNVYRVKIGNYLGQNFGIVTDVTDSEIKLTELVQDSAGDWTERGATVPLTEAQGKQ